MLDRNLEQATKSVLLSTPNDLGDFFRATQSAWSTYAEQALAAIHRGNTKRFSLTLGYGNIGESVSLYCRFSDRLKTLVENQLATAYGPACRFTRYPDDAFEPPAGYRRWSTEICLCPQLYSFITTADYEDALNRNLADPVAQILAAIGSNDHDRSLAQLEIVLRPASERCRRHAQNANRILRCPSLMPTLFLRSFTHTQQHILLWLFALLPGSLRS